MTGKVDEALKQDGDDSIDIVNLMSACVLCKKSAVRYRSDKQNYFKNLNFFDKLKKNKSIKPFIFIT